MKLKNLVCIIFAISCFAIFSSAAFAYTQADYIDAVKKAGDRLVALQSGLDYGWDWDVTGQSSWVGDDCGGQSCQNLYGVTSLGLIDAFSFSGEATHSTAADNVARFMTNVLWGSPSSGGFWNGGTIGGRVYYFGYSFDYKFLIRYSDLLDVSNYSTYAKSAWNWQKANATGEPPRRYADGNQSAIFQNTYCGPSTCTQSYGYAAWQSSDYGLAALEMGDTSWARNMATVVNNNMTNILANTDEYRVIGWGKALELLVKVDPVTYASSITSLKNKLESTQLASGCWDAGNSEGSSQDTAYAVLGLIAADDLLPAKKGVDCLVTNQLANGGWGTTEYSETDSEGLQAIAALLKTGEAVVSPKVVSVVLSPPSPVKAGTLLINVDFDKTMNTSIFPNVTIVGPHVYTVVPNPSYPNGWLDSDTWVGKIVINSSTKEGTYRLFIKNAKDIFGNRMAQYSEVRFVIDSGAPVILETFAPNIYDGEVQTLSATVYDPTSSGISHVSVKIDSGSEQDMTFSYSAKEKVDGKSVYVDTYFKMISSLTQGPHTVTFKVYDNAGNTGEFSTYFDVLADTKSYGGKIAYLCHNDDCDYGVEQSAINFLEANGWIVTGKAYNKWTTAELETFDLIVCSEQTKACKPTADLTAAHKAGKVALVELSSTPSVKAGDAFNYVKSSAAGASRLTTDILITTPDSITAGYFGLTQILNSAQKIPATSDRNLGTGVVDLSSRFDNPDYSNLFKIDGTSSHGRYVGILWFNVRTVSDHLRGYDLGSLTPTGQLLLKRAFSWAQCGSPLGCLSS
jgi:hypothetical protein